MYMWLHDKQMQDVFVKHHIQEYDKVPWKLVWTFSSPLPITWTNNWIWSFLTKYAISIFVQGYGCQQTEKQDTETKHNLCPSWGH